MFLLPFYHLCFSLRYCAFLSAKDLLSLLLRSRIINAVDGIDFLRVDEIYYVQGADTIYVFYIFCVLESVFITCLLLLFTTENTNELLDSNRSCCYRQTQIKTIFNFHLFFFYLFFFNFIICSFIID